VYYLPETIDLLPVTEASSAIETAFSTPKQTLILFYINFIHPPSVSSLNHIICSSGVISLLSK
jgi:hypothetical protein